MADLAIGRGSAYLVWPLVNAAIWLALPYVLRPYLPSPREPLSYLAACSTEASHGGEERQMPGTA